MTRYKFSIDDGALLVLDSSDGHKAWQGKPLEIAVESVLPIPSSDDCLVLLNWREAQKKSTRNLLRFSPDGIIKWKVNTPTKTLKGLDRINDVYTSIKVENKAIEANSFWSFLDYIDIDTGEILDTIFLK